MHLTIWLTPLAWLSAWQGYLSGSNQLAARLATFGRGATRGRVDLTARLGCKGSPGVQAKGNLAMFRWKATDLLPSIPVPALILAGTKDIVTLPQASRDIASALPRARLVQLEGGGHMAFLEQADACVAEIAAFAQEVLLRAPADAMSDA
jgi:pimeloyl-ACP methyl ester carboxylesterase